MARENKKDLILQTAIDLFYSKGFNATSTAEIARNAGIAESTIFRHFKTKNDLLLSILENFIATYGQMVIIAPIQDIIEKSKGNDIKDILKMIMKDRLTLFEKNSEILWIIMTEMKYHPQLKDALHENIAKEGMRIIHSIFENGIESGALRQCDPDTVVRSFLGTAISVILQYKVFSELSPSDKSIDDVIDEALDLFMNGILRKE